MHGNNDIVVGVLKGYHMACKLHIVSRKNLKEVVRKIVYNPKFVKENKIISYLFFCVMLK